MTPIQEDKARLQEEISLLVDHFHERHPDHQFVHATMNTTTIQTKVGDRTTYNLIIEVRVI